MRNAVRSQLGLWIFLSLLIHPLEGSPPMDRGGGDFPPLLYGYSYGGPFVGDWFPTNLIALVPNVTTNFDESGTLGAARNQFLVLTSSPLRITHDFELAGGSRPPRCARGGLIGEGFIITVAPSPSRPEGTVVPYQARFKVALTMLSPAARVDARLALDQWNVAQTERHEIWSQALTNDGTMAIQEQFFTINRTAGAIYTARFLLAAAVPLAANSGGYTKGGSLIELQESFRLKAAVTGDALRISSEDNEDFSLERSTNLWDWVPLEIAPHEDGSFPLPKMSPSIFYRGVRP